MPHRKAAAYRSSSKPLRACREESQQFPCCLFEKLLPLFVGIDRLHNVPNNLNLAKVKRIQGIFSFRQINRDQLRHRLALLGHQYRYPFSLYFVHNRKALSLELTRCHRPHLAPPPWSSYHGHIFRRTLFLERRSGRESASAFALRRLE